MSQPPPPEPSNEVLRLAAIVASSDDAIVSKDLNGIVTSWNRAAERMFGYTAEEMIGRSITTIIPLARIDEEDYVLGQIRAGKSIEHFETIRRHKSGTLIPISLTVSPLLAPGGTVIGASKIARDISDRRRAEEAIAVANARQEDLKHRLVELVAGSRKLFESPRLKDVLPAVIRLSESLLPADGYAIWRLDGAPARWNIDASHGISDEFTQRLRATDPPPSADERLRSAEPTWIADIAASLIAPPTKEIYAAEGIRSLLIVPLSGGGTENGALVVYYRRPHATDDNEMQLARAIGHLGGAAISTAELYDAQRRSREDATNAYRQASDASRAKDEFLATLSHELRTPLNAVLGWARMLRAGTVAPARVDRALEVIERNAAAQSRLIEDMLDLSRIITGNLRLDVKPMRLSNAITAAVETMLPAARAKDIKIIVNAGAGDTIIGDGSRLQQVVWNLLSNAVKFTPAGGAVTVSLRRADSTLEMEVADTGEGIDAAVLPFVFDRFRQGDSGTTRAHMGLGLGLAIVRHIIEMHGGRVSVSSEGRGTGATFRVLLPAAPMAHENDLDPGVRAVPAPADAPSNGAALAGIRALVIDDDADALDLMTRTLETRGIVVESARSVKEGLAALDRAIPDIILSDLAMPDEDGYDLIRSIRGRPAASGGLIPAIAVTAFARNGESERSIDHGFQDHLTKPIDSTQLFSAIERLAAPDSRIVE